MGMMMSYRTYLHAEGHVDLGGQLDLWMWCERRGRQYTV
jgi:hypothetical protein